MISLKSDGIIFALRLLDHTRWTGMVYQPCFSVPGGAGEKNGLKSEIISALRILYHIPSGKPRFPGTKSEKIAGESTFLGEQERKKDEIGNF